MKKYKSFKLYGLDNDDINILKYLFIYFLLIILVFLISINSKIFFGYMDCVYETVHRTEEHTFYNRLWYEDKEYKVCKEKIRKCYFNCKYLIFK